ncbi:MAG TPA: redoxin domain-containing protein [Candidatus Paceibacterota bacterium]|nr:redoxin domain-containing protein [Candidatus Paceibacterota bacterium]
MKKKNILLIIAVALIVVAIGYLEAKKPASINSPAEDIVVSGNLNASSSSSSSTVADRSSIQAAKAREFSRAKEFVDPTGFINTNSFKLSDLVGHKVVLLDIWTYSCINCLRTIPYLNAWYQKYKDDGLVIVGIHSPEFNFEKDYNNVSAAVKKLGIQYPVVLDSNHGIWNAYQNLYWPREYLIDIDGFIVHDKIGEGDYDGTERAIQTALRERSDALGLNLNIPSTIVSPADVISMDENKIGSKETYFGSARNVFLGNGEQNYSGNQKLTLPAEINPNTLYLDGTWNFTNEYAENTEAGAKIVYKYSAKNVYLVASSKSGVKLKILIDGAPIDGRAGSDVGADGTVTVKDNRLYDIVHGADYGTHTLEIDIENSGLDAFTFTFG